MTSQEVGEGGDNEQKAGSAWSLRTGVCLRLCVYVLRRKVGREAWREGNRSLSGEKISERREKEMHAKDVI